MRSDTANQYTFADHVSNLPKMAYRLTVSTPQVLAHRNGVCVFFKELLRCDYLVALLRNACRERLKILYLYKTEV